MDEEQALAKLDEELQAALSGLTAPAHFAESVRLRAARERLTRLPEILDWIGWAAVLVILGSLCASFGPAFLTLNAALAVACVCALPAFWFGIRAIRELER